MSFTAIDTDTADVTDRLQKAVRGGVFADARRREALAGVGGR